MSRGSRRADRPSHRQRNLRATLEMEPAPMPPAVEPEPLGRLLSSEQEQVLLSGNPANDWTRVGTNQMLIPQHVLALPTFRPRIGLTSGVTVEMIGGTRRRIVGQQSEGAFGHSRSVRTSRVDADWKRRHSAAGRVRRPPRRRSPSSMPSRLPRSRCITSTRRERIPRASRRESRPICSPPAARSRGRRRSTASPRSRNGWRLPNGWPSTGRGRQRRSPARNCRNGSRPTGRSRSR